MNAAAAAWRKQAISIITGEIPSTETQRRLAWRFLAQNGVK